MSPLEQWAAIEFNAAVLLIAAAAILVVGLMASTRRAEAYFASDRNVGSILGGATVSAAFLSAAPFLGLAGSLFALGSDGLAWIVGIGTGFVLMGIVIAPAFRASGALTVPEFLAMRFGGGSVPLLAAVPVTACCLLLLVAQLVAIGTLAQHALDLPSDLAIAGAALVIAIVLAAGGMRAATWLLALLLLAVLVAYLVPLGTIAWQKHGIPVGQLAYGQTLQEVRNLEIDMLGEELADASSLKPHLRPFLQIDYANTLALILCVAAGTAVLPHVLMRTAVTRNTGQTRLAMAWSLLFTTLVLSAIPAYAALAKHEIYRTIAKGVPFAQLPDVFARQDIAVHGVRLGLYDAVANAVRSGGDVAAVGDELRARWPQTATEWAALKPEVQSALVDAGKTAGGFSAEQRFETWRSTILPVAAIAAGNSTGKLTQSAIAIEPGMASFAAFALAGLSPAWITTFAVGGILAALATGIATTWAVASALARDLPLASRAPGAVTGTATTRLAVLAVTAVAAALAIYAPANLPTIAAWTFSLAAAGLLPALVLGIWWKRATRAGAIAGIIGGLAITLFYIGGTYFVPAEMFDMTSNLSDGGGPALDEATALEAAAAKATPETQATARAALDTYLRGTEVKPGAANWFGIHNSSAAVFGLPLGFLLIILVSLMTRRTDGEAQQFFEAVRRPSA